MKYIRADANECIGTGHVMRCLSIAEELRDQGEEVTFITADRESSSIIEKYGFEIICLNSEWDNLEKETDSLVRIIQERQISFLLIDSYYVTEAYLRAIGRYAKTAYIDDLDRFLYPVDLLINYNIYAEELDYPSRYQRAGQRTAFALGCSYAPLRKEFRHVRRETRDEVKEILITSGGTDRYNVAGQLLEALHGQTWFEAYEYTVIVGKFNGNRKSLEEKWGRCGNIHLLSNVNNMGEHMKRCDVAIAAGGSTTYELCACGVPAILYTMADNQRRLAETVSRMGLIPYVGDVREGMSEKVDRIIRQLERYFDDADERKEKSQSMRRIVDGEGCRRLAQKIAVL